VSETENTRIKYRRRKRIDIPKVIVYDYDPNYIVMVKKVEKNNTLYIYFKHRKTNITLSSVRIKGGYI